MILINHIADKNTSLSNSSSLLIIKIILLITEVIFIKVNGKACYCNYQGNHSSHESSLDRKSETSQSLSLLVLHAAVEEFVTLYNFSSASLPLSSGGSNLSFVSLPFFLNPSFFFLVTCFLFFDLIIDVCARGHYFHYLHHYHHLDFLVCI